MGEFRKLRVWQKAKDLAVLVYSITNKGGFNRDYSLRDQIRRAAVSISSNIAEGDELGSDKQAIRHFYIAKGSSAEVLTQACIAEEIGYIDEKEVAVLAGACAELSKMLMRLIQARSKSGGQKNGCRA